MSQASKALKEIAAGDEYTTLVQVIEKSDYEAIANAYQQVSNIISEKKNAILEQIDSLPKQNSGENRQQFVTAFTQRMGTTLPHFSKLNELISAQNIAEGEVFDIGSKGDPILKNPAGKTIIVSGVQAEKGTRIKYKVTNEGQKVDFARAIVFNADFFYTLLNQETLNQIQEAFNIVESRLPLITDELTVDELNEMLAALEKVREIAGSLKTTEKEMTFNKILTLKKKLLGDYGVRLAFNLIAYEEEKEIRNIQVDNEQVIALALTAPGIFRRQAYYIFRNGLFAGRNLKGIDKIQNELESNLDSMENALKLMEFKTTTEELEPSARNYISKMDQLYDNLNNKARHITFTIAGEEIVTVSEMQEKIASAFSIDSMQPEIKRVFQSPGELLSSREAAFKLKALLGDKDIQACEAAIRPYIKKTINRLFEKRTAGFAKKSE